jgi:hypothetical protein
VWLPGLPTPFLFCGAKMNRHREYGWLLGIFEGHARMHLEDMPVGALRTFVEKWYGHRPRRSTVKKCQKDYVVHLDNLFPIYLN